MVNLPQVGPSIDREFGPNHGQPGNYNPVNRPRDPAVSPTRRIPCAPLLFVWLNLTGLTGSIARHCAGRYPLQSVG